MGTGVGLLLGHGMLILGCAVGELVGRLVLAGLSVNIGLLLGLRVNSSNILGRLVLTGF